MPDERFEPMEIASGPDSGHVSGRWHGDGGEGMRLCVECRNGAGGKGPPLLRHDGPTHVQSRHPRARHVHLDQFHQHNHFAQIRPPESFWRRWVFHVSGSRRRHTLLLGRPPRTRVRDLSCWQPGGIDLPATLLVGCRLNSRQINHLQRVASETHYRGQSAPGTGNCEDAPGR